MTEHDESVVRKVNADYNAIADAFNETRTKPWPEFEAFKNALHKLREESAGQPKKEREGQSAQEPLSLLDVGCGNGRLAHYLHDEPISYHGIDTSAALLSKARASLPTDKSQLLSCSFTEADMRALPFPEETFHCVAAVASLHHLPTPQMQTAALREIYRVLKKPGLLFITVWDLWQERYREMIDPTTQHATIPWKRGVQEGEVERFYYAFKKEEFEDLLKHNGFPSYNAIPSTHNFAYLCNVS
ncbi:hypothetical protein CO046_05135 [Candidatus Peregrinibacteria bacterium CG_4_9_14_0_2_um_filter_53_11]|nr:MAG: hypothetical protein CO046_05135 [Candidatus Peregrinibacteria bacterium CG_4_9_14_0_2_um_filter_53_11]